MITHPDNYCYLPFRGMQIDCDGILTPCCLYKPEKVPGYKADTIENFNSWWNTSLTDLRNTVLADSIDPGCNGCDSHPLRKTTNKIFSWHPINQVAKTPQLLTIRVGNFCNLKCLMCNPKCSSQIAHEYVANKQIYNQHEIDYDSFDLTPNPWWENPVTMSQIIEMCKDAKMVNFSGGEPLIVPAICTMLENLPTDCNIIINTNLSKLNSRLIDQFKRFTNLKIQVSLDGAGAHHEYIRWGSSWAMIDKNIKTLLELPVKLEFSFLLQHTSIYTWPALWEYLEPLGKHIFIVPVYEKSINGLLTLDSVPQHDVDNFIAQNKMPLLYRNIFDNWISTYKFNNDLHQKFKQYINMIDTIRGCDFKNTFLPTW